MTASSTLPPKSLNLSAEEARLLAKIQALQQLQARQRHQRRDQRRHQLVDDLTPSKPPSGLRFSYAFLLVLALHVAVAGGFFGYSAIKKLKTSDRIALEEKKPAYAGVPDASPTASPQIKDTPQNQKSPQVATAIATPSPKKSVASKSKHHSSSEPSAKIRELFAKRHPSTASHDSSTAVSSDNPSPVASAVAAMGPIHETPSAPKIHNVLPSETLAGIAKAEGVKTAALREANHLDQSDDLRVGQKLTIPAPVPDHALRLVDSTPEPTSVQHDEPEQFVPKLDRIAPNGIYTVQRGDNPYTVARRLGVSFADLMVANSISNPANISIGMRLKVPDRSLASN